MDDEFNSSVFSPGTAPTIIAACKRCYYWRRKKIASRCNILNAFVRMYGADAVEAASAAMSGAKRRLWLQPVDGDLHAFAAHQSLLKAYEKLQRAKAAFWAK